MRVPTGCGIGMKWVAVGVTMGYVKGSMVDNNAKHNMGLLPDT